MKLYSFRQKEKKIPKIYSSVYTRRILHEQKQTSYRNSKWDIFTSFLHLKVLGTPLTVFNVIIMGT